MGGGTQNAPCIGIVASRIVLSDPLPNPQVGNWGGGFLRLWEQREEGC